MNSISEAKRRRSHRSRNFWRHQARRSYEIQFMLRKRTLKSGTTMRQQTTLTMGGEEGMKIPNELGLIRWLDKNTELPKPGTVLR